MSGNVDDFFKMLKFGFEGCALVVGLIALPFVIAAHKERCKKQIDAMSAKARELGFEFAHIRRVKIGSHGVAHRIADRRMQAQPANLAAPSRFKTMSPAKKSV